MKATARLVLTSLLLALPTGLHAQDRALTLEDYLDMESVGDARISPDDSRIVYTGGLIDRVNDRR